MIKAILGVMAIIVLGAIGVHYGVDWIGAIKTGVSAVCGVVQ